MSTLELKGMTDKAPSDSRFARIDAGRGGRITEGILDRPRDLIARGALRPGDRLPTERDLALSLGASLDDPRQLLVHDIRFHGTIARAAGNAVLATAAEPVSAVHYERRSRTIARARDLRERADEHRTIFAATRARSSEDARRSTAEHVGRAGRTSAAEEEAVAADGGERPSRGRTR